MIPTGVLARPRSSSGREPVERVRDLRPGLRVLLISGYNEDEVLRTGVLGPGMAFLEKPFQPATLLQRVTELLAAEARV